MLQKCFMLLLTCALLLTSTVILSGCRALCADSDLQCPRSGISATYTPPIPPTPPEPNRTEPKTTVRAFFNVYDGTSAGMEQMSQLFSRKYTVRPAVLACAFRNTKDTYGPPSIVDVIDPTTNGDRVTVFANMTTPLRTITVTFSLERNLDSWKIESINGWFGGDITPENPVGEFQSCLQ